MSDVAGEQEKVKSQFSKVTKETGTCAAFKVFNLGSNGTVYVGCGLYSGHDKYGDESIMYHIASHRSGDDSVVTFKWAL